MKLLPIPLPTLGAPPPLGMWGSDLMWRYSAPPSPLAELKTQLPPQLAADPRLWNREDVALFLQFCEREFDLPKFDLDLFQMNGKALCLLTKNDLAERIPGAGDVLHNVLQMLIRELQMLHKHLPSSPVTPTSRYPFSPLSQPPTPNWSALPPPDSPFHPAHIQHLMQSNSVTLSPAPSVDSQGRSPPQHQEQNQIGFAQNSSSSNQSDSDEDSYSEKPHQQQHQQHQQPEQQASPPLTPLSKEPPLTLSQQISNVVNSWSVQNENSGSNSAPSTPGAFVPVKREFFPDTPEPNTNGRLLWDFLQQLLNCPSQRYSNFIAWKSRETGVFKIVDPAGLAKLWGIQKNHLSMNYDKMSRALRYYYRVNILRKVQGERHCYQFLRNPTELKSIKNISLLRQQAHQIQNNQNTSSTSNTTNTLKQQSVETMSHSHLPSPNSSSAAMQQQSSASSSSAVGVSNLNTQHHLHHLQLPHQHMQNPPSSPRVHALNGAFHHLSTSSPVMMNSPSAQQSGEPHTFDFKIEPNIGDDLPTDLSTSSDRKYSNSSECYPLIRNSNGLTTIRLISQNNDNSLSSFQQHSMQQQQQQMDDYPSAHDRIPSENIKMENGAMATDLRKID